MPELVEENHDSQDEQEGQKIPQNTPADGTDTRHEIKTHAQ
jgi:hypothetical protein